MYLEHFGLREAPFRITPHTEFFFSGANRGATLEALIYAITHDEGIVKVSGEVGSGKTMLCRMLLERLPADVETVYLANPSLSRDEIFYAIAEELRAPLPEGGAHQLLRALQQRLIEIYATDRQVVVMIDEAHAMPAETLEEIRLLSNLESNRHKLLHIVLFGQPELDAHLRLPAMRPLKERITHNFALEPLRSGDVAKLPGIPLARRRLPRPPSLFTASAIQRISRASEGLTRRINIIADKALLSAFTENRQQIDDRQAQAAIRDAEFNPIADHPGRPAIWLVAAVLAALIGGFAYLAGNRSTPSVPLTTAEALGRPRGKKPPRQPRRRPPTEAPTEAAPETPPENDFASAAAGQPPARQRPANPPLTPCPSVWRPARSGSKPLPTRTYFIQLFNADAKRSNDVSDFLERSALDPARAARLSLQAQRTRTVLA